MPMPAFPPVESPSVLDDAAFEVVVGTVVDVGEGVPDVDEDVVDWG